ncbi:hypothetical protein AgCh_031396 [Apium graveolens]
MVHHNVVVSAAVAQISPAVLLRSHSPPFHFNAPRGEAGRIKITCSAEEHSVWNKVAVRNALSGIAASFVLLSHTTQVLGADLTHHQKVYGLANVSDTLPSLPIDTMSEEKIGMMMMTKGMSTKNFDPVRYSGRWFEVASLKRGFAGAGQEDCHCTQVDTFCVHGGPDGYITGIRGNVQCLSDEDLEKNVTELEKQEMVKGKCYLRFPTLPFIPKEPYDVIATDYDNYALVSGAKDKSFIQIYSRTPNPGPEFIEKYKLYLADFGYDPNKIIDTPQDCDVSDSRLAAMMSMNGNQQALTNQFPDLELKSAVAFDPFTSVFDTLKKLVQLYFK